jgi:hypothetical protein
MAAFDSPLDKLAIQFTKEFEALAIDSNLKDLSKMIGQLTFAFENAPKADQARLKELIKQATGQRDDLAKSLEKSVAVQLGMSDKMMSAVKLMQDAKRREENLTPDSPRQLKAEVAAIRAMAEMRFADAIIDEQKRIENQAKNPLDPRKEALAQSKNRIMREVGDTGVGRGMDMYRNVRGTLSSPIALGAASLLLLAKSADMVVDAFKDMRTEFGYTASKFGREFFPQIGRSFTEFFKTGRFIGPGDRVRIQQGLANQLGTRAPQTVQNTVGILGRDNGIDPDLASRVTEQLFRQSGYSQTIADNARLSANALAEQTGVTQRQIFEDMANNSEAMAHSAGMMPGAFQAALIRARQIGVEFSKFTSRMDGMVTDFEGTLMAQAKIQTMFPQADLSEMMYAAQFGTEETFMAATQNMVNSLGLKNMSELPRSIRLAISEASGFSVSEMQNMLQGVAPGAKMPDGTAQLETKAIDRLINSAFDVAGSFTGLLGPLGLFLGAIILATASLGGLSVASIKGAAGKIGGMFGMGGRSLGTAEALKTVAAAGGASGAGTAGLSGAAGSMAPSMIGRLGSAAGMIGKGAGVAGLVVGAGYTGFQVGDKILNPLLGQRSVSESIKEHNITREMFAEIGAREKQQDIVTNQMAKSKGFGSYEEMVQSNRLKQAAMSPKSQAEISDIQNLPRSMQLAIQQSGLPPKQVNTLIKQTMPASTSITPIKPAPEGMVTKEQEELLIQQSTTALRSQTPSDGTKTVVDLSGLEKKISELVISMKSLRGDVYMDGKKVGESVFNALSREPQLHRAR